jgi:hypothetical protein
MYYQFSGRVVLSIVWGVLFGVQVKALQASYDFIIVGGVLLLSLFLSTTRFFSPLLFSHSKRPRGPPSKLPIDKIEIQEEQQVSRSQHD